jgi:glycosyltransferase involved in cell wall biosynthesis
MADLPQARCLVDVPEADLSALFERAWLVVLPYAATTGASSVIYRAAAWGRPVAASALPELTAQSEESGLRVSFFPPGSAEGMRVVISSLLDDDEARASMAAHNLGVAAQTGMDATLRAYLETFDLALRGRNGTSLVPSPQAQTAAHEA